jgi:hypothetical protein
MDVDYDLVPEAEWEDNSANENADLYEDYVEGDDGGEEEEDYYTVSVWSIDIG